MGEPLGWREQRRSGDLAARGHCAEGTLETRCIEIGERRPCRSRSCRPCRTPPLAGRTRDRPRSGVEGAIKSLTAPGDADRSLERVSQQSSSLSVNGSLQTPIHTGLPSVWLLPVCRISIVWGEPKFDQSMGKIDSEDNLLDRYLWHNTLFAVFSLEKRPRALLLGFLRLLGG